MVADLNVHWDLGADRLVKPHAHVMLNLREVDKSGFVFLKNERILDVKNGTLGTVETAAAQRMSVTLDVLATPGLDRHGAYVALSRHRDRIDLHCGRDDFLNLATLKSTLSRARTKDLASDWIDDFAERRGLEPPSLADKARAFGEAVRRHAKVVLDMFKRQDQKPARPATGRGRAQDRAARPERLQRLGIRRYGDRLRQQARARDGGGGRQAFDTAFQSGSGMGAERCVPK